MGCQETDLQIKMTQFMILGSKQEYLLKVRNASHDNYCLIQSQVNEKAYLLAIQRHLDAVGSAKPIIYELLKLSNLNFTPIERHMWILWTNRHTVLIK